MTEVSDDLPFIEHYMGDKADAHQVRLPFITIWFSYRTPIAYMTRSGRLRVRINSWGATTGKHINEIDGGSDEAKRDRLTGDVFERQLALVFQKHNDTTEHRGSDFSIK